MHMTLYCKYKFLQKEKQENRRAHTHTHAFSSSYDNVHYGSVVKQHTVQSYMCTKTSPGNTVTQL